MATARPQIGRRELLRLRRERVLAVMLVLLAGMLLPLGTCLLADCSQAAALIAPSLVLTAAISLICPRGFVPPLAVAGMYAVELIIWSFQRQRADPNVLERLLKGQLELLWIPALAMAAGWVLVYGRQRWWPRLLRPGFRTNLRILGRRPGAFWRKYWPALTAVVIAAVLDMLTTIKFMLLTGPKSELHPAMRSMAVMFGVVLGVGLGTLGRLVFVVVVAAIWRKSCTAVMILCAVLYTLAAMSNYFRWL